MDNGTHGKHMLGLDKTKLHHANYTNNIEELHDSESFGYRKTINVVDLNNF
jgi:hypothetical protein